jgi:hypothetical protein
MKKSLIRLGLIWAMIILLALSLSSCKPIGTNAKVKAVGNCIVVVKDTQVASIGGGCHWEEVVHIYPINKDTCK